MHGLGCAPVHLLSSLEESPVLDGKSESSLYCLTSSNRSLLLLLVRVDETGR